MKKTICKLCLLVTAFLIMVSGAFQKSIEWTLVGCTLYIATVVQLKEISVNTHVRANNVNVVVKDDAEGRPERSNESDR